MPPPKPKKRGVWQNSRTHGGHTNDDNLVDQVADFSYSSDALAQLIVEMWQGQHGNLLQAPNPADYVPRSANAKAEFAARGIYLQQPIVITEAEYDAGFSLADANLNNGVVFVVPNQVRATTTGAPPLIETAKMLMAITPNGI
jgi:hypothetical protein